MLQRSKSATSTPKRTHGPNRHGGHRPEAATGKKSGLLLFVLLYFIEKRSLLSTLAVSIGIDRAAACTLRSSPSKSRPATERWALR